MAETGTIVAQMVFCLVAVLLLLLVAREQWRRKVQGEDANKALRSFVLWWLVLAIFYFEQFLFNASRFVIDWSGTGLLAMGVFEAAFMVAAFGFLIDYLAFIITGHIHWRRWIMGYYAVLFVMIAVVAPLTGPYAVVEDAMGPRLEGTVPAFGLAAVLFLMVPIFAAVGLLMRLFLKATESPVQYRLGMLAVAILAFLLALGTQGTIPKDINWTIGSGGIMLAGGGVIIEGFLPIIGAWAAFRAYHPAAWVRVKLGLLHDADHPKAPLPPLERR